MREDSNRVTWIIIGVLSIILVTGLALNQPLGKDEAIDIAKELVPGEYNQVYSTEYIPMKESELGVEIWNIQLENSEEDMAILKINARNGKLLEGTIQDGETGEVLEKL